MAELTKNVKRTYLKYLAFPDAILDRLVEGGDESPDGFPINQDFSQARSSKRMLNLKRGEGPGALKAREGKGWEHSMQGRVEGEGKEIREEEGLGRGWAG